MHSRGTVQRLRRWCGEAEEPSWRKRRTELHSHVSWGPGRCAFWCPGLPPREWPSWSSCLCCPAAPRHRGAALRSGDLGGVSPGASGSSRPGRGLPESVACRQVCLLVHGTGVTALTRRQRCFPALGTLPLPGQEQDRTLGRQFAAWPWVFRFSLNLSFCPRSGLSAFHRVLAPGLSAGRHGLSQVPTSRLVLPSCSAPGLCSVVTTVMFRGSFELPLLSPGGSSRGPRRRPPVLSAFIWETLSSSGILQGTRIHGCF